MVGLACISKCGVCEKGRRTGIAAAAVDEKERAREGEEGGQEEAEQESCMHLN